MSLLLSNSDMTSETSLLQSDPLRREKPPVRPSGSHTMWSLAWAPWQLENITHFDASKTSCGTKLTYKLAQSLSYS